MISHGVEISIPGGGADTLYEKELVSFFSVLFSFIQFFVQSYIVVKVQETTSSASYGENNAKRAKKPRNEKSMASHHPMGSVPVAGLLMST